MYEPSTDMVRTKAMLDPVPSAYVGYVCFVLCCQPINPSLSTRGGVTSIQESSPSKFVEDISLPLFRVQGGRTGSEVLVGKVFKASTARLR